MPGGAVLARHGDAVAMASVIYCLEIIQTKKNLLFALQTKTGCRLGSWLKLIPIERTNVSELDRAIANGISRQQSREHKRFSSAPVLRPNDNPDKCLSDRAALVGDSDKNIRRFDSYSRSFQ
jgi:hypothetical protein